MAKWAGIYERNGVSYIFPSHQTQAGFLTGDETVDVVDITNVEKVREAVIAALARSREGVPTPPPSNKITDPLLEAAKVKSWKAFAKSAKYVSITQNGDTIELMPGMKMDARGGFVFVPEKTRIVPASDAGLGQVILAALADSE